jgi:hypothetical protein
LRFHAFRYRDVRHTMTQTVMETKSHLESFYRAVERLEKARYAKI